jgi:hypothetical protein
MPIGYLSLLGQKKLAQKKATSLRIAEMAEEKKLPRVMNKNRILKKKLTALSEYISP